MSHSPLPESCHSTNGCRESDAESENCPKCSDPPPSRSLATWAGEGGAPLLLECTDRTVAPTTATPQSFTIVDSERTGKETGVAVGRCEITKRRTASFDRLLQYGSERGSQCTATWRRRPPPSTQRSGSSPRSDAGTMQCFTCVDVAHPGHDLLIQQGRFDAAPTAVQLRSQHLGREGCGHRLGAELPQNPMLRQSVGGHAFHAAEPTWIVVHEEQPPGHGEHHMVVGVELPRMAIEHGERTAHTQMTDQRLVAGQFDHQILAPTTTPGNATACDPVDQIILKWPTQPGAAQLDG